MAQLYAEGAISKQQRDESVADATAAGAGAAEARAGLAGATEGLAAARSQLRAATASQAQARAGVDAANVPLANATVVAPFDGVIVATFVDPGAVVGAGSPVVAIEDAHALEVDVAVPDDRAAALAPGLPVAVRVDAADADVTGHVRAVVPSQNAALRSATVKIDVPAAPALQPGMYARVSFATRSRAGWTAPLAALVTRGGQSGVFVVRDGRASFAPVDAGDVGASRVELRGYRGGVARVAVTETQRLDDGSAVTVAR
jgi:RND family efflux transporter MFP subunit